MNKIVLVLLEVENLLCHLQSGIPDGFFFQSGLRTKAVADSKKFSRVKVCGVGVDGGRGSTCCYHYQ